MNGRLQLSLVGLVVIGITFFILFEYPQYATEAFYLLIGWMILNFALLYTLRPRVPSAPTDASTEASPFPSAPGSAPLPSTSGSSPSPSGGIGFCIFCATPVPPGTRVCPACGHALPQW